jgi:hypothetical protein
MKKEVISSEKGFQVEGFLIFIFKKGGN